MARAKLVNRIALYRQQIGGMSQEGLAIRVGTSQQQISRIEKGQKTTPAMAQSIAEALNKPIGLVFPDLGADASATTEPALTFIERFANAGFEMGSTIPVNGLLTLKMRGIEEEFSYVVSHDDAKRFESILSREIDDDDPNPRRPIPIFFAMWAQGRYVVLRITDLVWATVYDSNTVVKLEESFTDLRVFIRGEEPFVISFDDLPFHDDGEYDYWHDWMFLGDSFMPSPRFVMIRDLDEMEDRFINVNDVILLECPSKALIDEIYREGPEESVEDAINETQGVAVVDDLPRPLPVLPGEGALALKLIGRERFRQIMTEETGFDSRKHDPRTTEEIRQDYLEQKRECADDPLLTELADAGLALLDAEVASWEAKTKRQKTETLIAVTEAQRRMDAAQLAVQRREGDKPH